MYQNRYIFILHRTIVIENLYTNFQFLISKIYVNVYLYFPKLITTLNRLSTTYFDLWICCVRDFLGSQPVYCCTIRISILNRRMLYTRNDLFIEYCYSVQSPDQWTFKIILQWKRDSKHDECLNWKANKALWRTNSSNCITIFNREISPLSNQVSSLEFKRYGKKGDHPKILT